MNIKNKMKMIKYLISYIMLFIIVFHVTMVSQTCISNIIPIECIKEDKSNLSTLAGSCASPDGPDKIIGSPPPSYAWLQANNYCYSIGPTKNLTVCYTMTSSATTATFNSGFSSTGCASISFSGFNLYTCNPGCVLVGTGLTFSGLTIGQCYTWCFSATCTGPGPGFTDLCPYYLQNSVLPVEIIYFAVNQEYKQNIIEWKTATEYNSSYFEIERAADTMDFTSIGAISASFNSNVVKKYQFVDKQPKIGLNYYRLKQFDRDGNNTTYSLVIVVDNKKGEMKPYKVFNTNGQEVDENYEGLKIIQYLDGKTIKIY